MVTIVSILDHMDVVPVVAKWIVEQWSFLAPTPVRIALSPQAGGWDRWRHRRLSG